MSYEDMERGLAKDRERYARSSSEKKRAKKDREYKRRALRRDTLSHHSIAMENPLNDPIDLVLPFSSSILVSPAITVDFSSPTQRTCDGEPPAMSIDTNDGNILYVII